MKQWKDSGRRELFAQVNPETINDGERTVDVIWFTGIDVDRYSWIEGAYQLRLDPKGADLSRLNSGAPVCDCHWMMSVDDQKGVVMRAWKDGTNYMATLRFKRSTEMTGPRPDLDGLWQDIKDKIVTKFSMGVEILESTDTRDKEGSLVMRTATNWRPFEISIAPIPADFGTDTLSGQPRPEEKPSLAAVNHRTRETDIARLR
jgi:hypothetical protein